MLIDKFTEAIHHASTVKIESQVNNSLITQLYALSQGVRTIKPILVNLLQIFEKIDDKLEKERDNWPDFDNLRFGV